MQVSHPLLKKKLDAVDDARNALSSLGRNDEGVFKAIQSVLP